MSLEKACKKLILVLATSTSITKTRRKVVKIAKTAETVETVGADKDGKKSKSEYLENLARAL